MAVPKRPRALINGFGRIGRLALRRSLGFGDVDLAAFEVVAVNDPLAVAESAAYLLEFDSTIGKFGSTTVAEDGKSFSITTAAGKESTFRFSRATNPAEVGLFRIPSSLDLLPPPPPPTVSHSTSHHPLSSSLSSSSGPPRGHRPRPRMLRQVPHPRGPPALPRQRRQGRRRLGPHR